jgi:HlyD family secretion protein
VSQQKAALEQLEFQYQRNQALYEKGAISRGEFEQIRSNYRSAEARLEAAQQTVQANRYQVQSAQANVREARENLNRTEIFAPIDGYVSRLNVESGERVVGTAQMEGTEMMRIADLNVMEALVEVNENDIVRLELGDSATVEVDALDNGRFDAVVTELANSAKQTTGVTDEATSFEVKLRVLRASYESRVDSTDPIPTPFRPGMSALVEIRTNRKKDVLSVPILAVTTRNLRSDSLSQEEAPSGDSEVETVVFARQGDKAQRRRVVTGIQDDTYIEIKEGLQEGVEIVSGPYNAVSNALRDGETIRLRSDQKKLRATR